MDPILEVGNDVRMDTMVVPSQENPEVVVYKCKNKLC